MFQQCLGASINAVDRLVRPYPRRRLDRHAITQTKGLPMKRTLIAIFAALGLCGYALFSWAQAPGAHGEHGGHDLIDAIRAVQAQLKLNTSQQQQWDNAVALSQAAHGEMRASFAQLKAATQAELAKSSPDLSSLATQADQLRQQTSPARAQARAAWLALYDTFSPEQKLVARDAINARLARMEARRAENR